MLTNIHLTQHQKQALATIFAASSATLAYEHISNGVSNLMAATKILDDLNLVIISDDDKITVTEEGKSTMRDEGLLDDTDALTDEGQKAIDSGAPEASEQPPTEPEVPIEQEPPMESFPLIREINFLTTPGARLKGKKTTLQ
ncbi:MAG: hypothetical protein ACREAU_00575 [Nitrosopumilaceae archaeon]